MNDFIKKLFQELQSQGIHYCHWKSTIRLDKSLAGETDLDILIDAAQRHAAEELVLKLGFKKIYKEADSNLPEGINFLGFDYSSGKFYHLHIYYKLLSGQKNVKAYHWPLERYFLQSQADYLGIKIPEPELELLIHLCRLIVKTSFKNLLRRAIRSWVKGKKDSLGLKELKWLINRADLDKFSRQFSWPELSKVRSESFMSLVRKPRDFGLWEWFNLKGQLRIFKRQVGKISSADSYVKRSTEKGGLSVAIMGIDGSGKSTIVKELVEKFSYKLRVIDLYLGSSNKLGQRSERARRKIFMARCFRYIYKLFNRQKVEKFYDEVQQQAFAEDRLSRYTNGEKLKQQGFIVIYERFPLANVADHPSVWGWNDSEKKSARMTSVEKLYQNIQGPDLLLLLDLPVEEALKRKSYGDEKVLLNKYQRLQTYFDQHRSDKKYLKIDAGQSVENIVRQIMTLIWERI